VAVAAVRATQPTSVKTALVALVALAVEVVVQELSPTDAVVRAELGLPILVLVAVAVVVTVVGQLDTLALVVLDSLPFVMLIPKQQLPPLVLV
jgi:hypothetical protein